MEKQFSTYKEKAQFILENIHPYMESSLEKCFKKTFDLALRKATGFHFDDGKQYTFNNFLVRYDKSIEENKTRFDKLLELYGIGNREFKIYERLNLIRDGRLQPRDKNYWNGGNDNSGLIEILMYLTEDKTYEDRALANKILDDNKISYNQIFEMTIGNITIKTFLNGRVDLKGITADQQTKLNRLFEINKSISTNRFSVE